jgi:hypothetical protein
MVSISHELGWIISLDDTIEALWEGSITPMTEPVWPSATRMIGYVEHGKEVLFDKQSEGIHIS